MSELMKRSDKIIAILAVAIASSFFVGMNCIFVVSLLITAIYFVIYKRLPVDLGDFFILFGMIAYFAISDRNIGLSLFLGIGITSVYMLGKVIAISGRELCADSTLYAVVAVAGALFVKGLLNYTYIIKNPDVIALEEWPNWRGVVLPRTQHEFYFVLTSVLLSYWILKLGMPTVQCMVGLICSLSGMLLAVYSKGRIAFFCTLCTTVIVFAAFVIDKHIYNRRWFQVATSILFVGIIAFYAAFVFNLYGLYDIYVGSMWSGSGGIIHNTRFSLMADALRMLREYPLGNQDYNLIEYNGTLTPYAHNSWIDIGKRGGVISMMLVVCFTVINVINIIRMWKKRESVDKYALIAAFTGVSLYHMVEPAIVADPTTWCLEVYLGGLVMGECDALKNKNSGGAS